MNTRLIYEYCEVVAHEKVFTTEIIYYKDCGFGVIETYNHKTREHDSYSCNGWEDYELIKCMCM